MPTLRPADRRPNEYTLRIAVRAAVIIIRPAKVAVVIKMPTMNIKRSARGGHRAMLSRTQSAAQRKPEHRITRNAGR